MYTRSKREGRESNTVDKWISTQEGEVMLTIEMSAHEIRVDDHYNPGFDVNRLPVGKQEFARATIVKDVRKQEEQQQQSRQSDMNRNPMKDSMALGSVRPNALASPHGIRQSEFRSPTRNGTGRMTLGNNGL